MGFPSSGADQRKWLIKLGYRLPQNGITKQWSSFPSGQTIQRTTSSIFSLIASFTQSDARSKFWYVWGQIKNSWLLYSYTLDFTRYGKSNSVSNESFWKWAQVSQTQPEREKTWQRARGSAFQCSVFSWRTDPAQVTEVTGREASAPSKEDLANSKSCSTTEWTARWGRVTGSVQGGKITLGEGTPAFVKRLDWMNLRSLSILRF